jgi:N-acylneuraminate cytidylyltransferase
VSAYAFIFARGGSKGLLGKNIKLFSGKPLIAWSIAHAKSVERISRVIVSTDSVEIAEVAKKYGAEVPFIRPTELAQDSTPEWVVWQHALNYLESNEGKLPDVFVSVPATAPLRSVLDINRCLDNYEKGGVDIVVTMTQAQRSPYFNMVKKNHNEELSLVIPPKNVISRRQDAPMVYDLATIAYVANPRFILNNNSIFDGIIRGIEIPAERAVDIDVAMDFIVAEILMNQSLKN